MGSSGTATLDFGVVGSTNVSDASIAVTEQTSILSNSLVEAWVSLSSTTDHSLDEIRIEDLYITAGNISAGVGFTIYGYCLTGTTYGTFTVNYAWV
jgi:hypothetical protein